MKDWHPDLAAVHPAPRYMAIADLSQWICAVAFLPSGTGCRHNASSPRRLRTASTSTVARGYVEAQKRGLAGFLRRARDAHFVTRARVDRESRGFSTDAGYARSGAVHLPSTRR